MIDILRRHPRYLEYPAEKYDFAADPWEVMFLNMGGPETAEKVLQHSGQD